MPLSLETLRATMLQVSTLELLIFSALYIFLIILIAVVTPNTFKNKKFIVMFLLLLVFEIVRSAYFILW